MIKFSVSKFRTMRLAILAFTFAVMGIGQIAFADDNNGSSDQHISNLTGVLHDKYEPMDRRIAACQGLGMPDCSEAGINGSTQGAAAAGGELKGGTTSSESECKSIAETANLACLTPGTANMEPGEAMMYTMMMNQLVTTGSQIATIGKNMSQQCKLQADVSSIMGTINGLKGTSCMAAVSKCSSTCDEEAQNHAFQAKSYQSSNQTAMAEQEDKLARAARTRKSRCSAMSGQSAAMMMAAMNNLGNFAVNKQCQNELAAYNAPPPLPTLAPIAGVGDCTDPNNQTLACFCSRPANSASAMCAGFGTNPLVGSGTTTVPNGSTIASPIGGTIADATDGNTIDPFAIPKKDGGGDQKGQGDGGSGAPGGGGLSSFASEGGGGGAYGDPRSAITGTSGGNATGLGSAGGGGGGGGLARNNGTAGKEGFFDKFNLKKFLPGSKYKTRGIAGMSVKSVDGITGPMGPTLFEKATRQYQEQIQKQNVILDK